MKTAGPYLSLIVLVALVYATAVRRWWRNYPRTRPVNMRHPAMRRFTRGSVPSHGAAPVTRREQQAFDALTAPLRQDPARKEEGNHDRTSRRG